MWLFVLKSLHQLGPYGPETGPHLKVSPTDWRNRGWNLGPLGRRRVLNELHEGKVKRIFTVYEISVGYKARKLNKICSGNLYPFSLESIVLLQMKADKVIRFQFSPSIFKIVRVYTDHLKAHLMQFYFFFLILL